jgi:hypothetical protein
MKKTGKMKHILKILFFSYSILTFSQVKFETKVGKTSIAQNEILRVEFAMNTDGDNFEPPTFEGFKIVGGPSQQVSQSWVNGKTSFSKSFIYFILPNKQGKTTIKSATIEINNQIYKTDPIAITVTKPVPQQQQQQQSRNPYDPYQQQPQIVTSADGKLHLIAEVSNSNPFLNEPITVVYKLYVHPNIGVSNWSEVEKPKFNGFWNNNFDMKSLKVEKGKFKGEDYIFAVLRKTVLYPQKSGKLEIEALGLELDIEVPTGRRDFWGNYQTAKDVKKVSTGTQIINVKPLPPNAPAGFTGAVGKFSLAVKTDKNTLKEAESLELNVVVSGTGNLKLFNLPKPTLPATFEVYDPENKQNIETPLSGMTGSISDKYTIIPQEKGDYTVNPLLFSYFDLGTKTYKTLTSDSIELKVLVNETLAQNDPKKVENNPKTKLLKGQFNSIKLKTNLKSTKFKDFYGSSLFYTLLIFPFLLIPLIIFINRKRKINNEDLLGKRLRINNKLAKKYLSEAKKHLNNKEPFYIALEKSLHNFLKAKLKIETIEMSKENIATIMQNRNANETTIQDFMKLLNDCEFARYAFQSQADIQGDYDKAVSLIASLDKELD